MDGHRDLGIGLHADGTPPIEDSEQGLIEVEGVIDLAEEGDTADDAGRDLLEVGHTARETDGLAQLVRENLDLRGTQCGPEERRDLGLLSADEGQRRTRRADVDQLNRLRLTGDLQRHRDAVEIVASDPVMTTLRGFQARLRAAADSAGLEIEPHCIKAFGRRPPCRCVTMRGHGDGVFEVSTQCPACFEWVEIFVDRDDRGRMVQDCDVCCRSMDVLVRWTEDGEPQIEVRSANG